MKSKDKPIPLVEEISDKSNPNNKKDIIISLRKNKKEEDDTSINSSNYSGVELKESHQKKEKMNNSLPFSFKNISKKNLEIYQEKLKENTMRKEIDKRYNETERLRKKYEEKKSNLHTFDNNPQYKKMLNRVTKQLALILLCGIIYLIFNLIIYYITSNSKESSAILGICLSIIIIAFCFILFIALNFGLLNDPNLSKTFRLFIVIESFIILFSFIFNIIVAFLCKKYLSRKRQFKNKFVFYFILLLMILISVAIFKLCWNLFLESMLILFGKKTEYSILIFKEQRLKSNEINFNTNLSLTNNMTCDNLVNSASLFNNEDKEEKDKEEEQYNAFNYFNNFHYSTSTRKGDYPGFKKN